MASFPKSVKILGKVYTVEPDASLESVDEAGVCLPWKCLIRIAGGLEIQQERDTVLHEVFHGLFYEMGYGSDHKLAEEEEKIVRGFATGTLAILRENPEFLGYLAETKMKRKRT